MRKVIVNEFVSLDGVAQAPGGEEEDTSGGFAHGGWSMQYMDEPAMTTVLGSINEAGAFLLGRRTYELFASYWPNAPEEEQVIAEPINTKPKHVASRTLENPLQWQNSAVLDGDVADAVAALKQEHGGDIHVICSLDLLKTLLERDLVDEFRLMVDPVSLGGGKRLFPEDGTMRPLRLVDSQVTTTGAILSTYARA